MYKIDVNSSKFYRYFHVCPPCFPSNRALVLSQIKTPVAFSQSGTSDPSVNQKNMMMKLEVS